MPVLKCTQTVRDFVGIDVVDTATSEASVLSSWYVNIFTVDRRKTLIFMEEQTLMSFIVFGLKKSNSSNLGLIFLRGLEQILRMEDVPVYQVERLASANLPIRYAKTGSRSALGSLNDLVFHYKYSILSDGGLSYCNLTDLIRNVNRMPQRKLQWLNSVEAMNKLLGGYPL